MGLQPRPDRAGVRAACWLSLFRRRAQIRAQFQLPDDLTEEEKLEPVRNFGDDPKIRLLNRLHDKKRKVRGCAPPRSPH